MKTKLTDKTDLQIVETNKEEGTIPNISFKGDENWGIAIDDLNHTIVERKVASRTIKNEDGTSHVESYYRWNPIAYVGTLESAIESYMNKREKRFLKTLHKCDDWSQIVDLRKETMEIVKNSLKNIKVEIVGE